MSSFKRKPREKKISFEDNIKKNPMAARCYKNYLDAEHQSRSWQAQGEYKWAKQWEIHANVMLKYAKNEKFTKADEMFLKKTKEPKNDADNSMF